MDVHGEGLSAPNPLPPSSKHVDSLRADFALSTSVHVFCGCTGMADW
jgi:hypothetical protein